MKKLIVSILILCVAVPSPCADKDAEIKKLRSEIAEAGKKIDALRTKIEQLKGRLDKLEGKSPAKAKSKRELDIRVMRDNWGDASLADIKAVLKSSAGELWKYFPERKMEPIIVKRSFDSPITLYKRGPNNEYFVKLNVTNRHWCQFAYQFAHEFCHILANYTEHGSRKNKWFEESVCELASMFTMHSMAESWKTTPPYPNWKGYSSSIQDYADNLKPKGDVVLKKGQTLAQWYKKHSPELGKNACLRPRNKVVADQLLKLFQENPGAWEAVGYLNRGKPDPQDSFEQYLGNWHKHAPEKYRPFIRKIAGMFEIKLAGK